jgi:hypothetical protein
VRVGCGGGGSPRLPPASGALGEALVCRGQQVAVAALHGGSEVQRKKGSTRWCLISFWVSQGSPRPARDAVEAIVCQGRAAALRWSAGRASPVSSDEREGTKEDV